MNGTLYEFICKLVSRFSILHSCDYIERCLLLTLNKIPKQYKRLFPSNVIMDENRIPGREKNVCFGKSRKMFATIFKSEFAYHFPSLKSNQFLFDGNILLLLLRQRLIQQLTHINLSKTFFHTVQLSSMSLSVSLLVNNRDSNWHGEVLMMTSNVSGRF